MRHQIVASWSADIESGRQSFDLEDLGCEVLDEWESLSEQEKQSLIQKALDDMPEQPRMVLAKFSVIHKK